MAAVQHLQRRGSVYRFRARIPNDLAAITGRTEVAVSLRTGNLAEAKQRLAVIRLIWERTMWQMRNAPALTREDIDRLVRDFIATEVGEATALHMAAKSAPALENRVKREEEERPKLRQMVASDLERGRPFWTQAPLESFLESRGVPVDRDSALYPEVMRALAHGWLSALDCLDGRADVAPAAPGAGAAAVAPPAPPAVAAPVPSSGRAPEAAQPWRFQEQRFFDDRPSIGASAQASHKQAFRELEAVIGTKPLGEVTTADIKAFADYLRDKPIERAGRTRLSRETIVKLLSHVRGYFGWCVEAGLIAENPADKVKPRTETREERDKIGRRAFTVGELETLFRSPLYTGCKGVNLRHQPGSQVFRDERYFFFLAAMLTGARTEELAEAPAKLVDHHGVLCLDLREAATKTSAGPRLVPILPDLEKVGFVAFARQQERAGKKLFREATGDWSGWTNGYLDKIGITDRAVTSYSMRHNFRQALRATGMSDELANKIFGHEGDSVGAGYGRELAPAEARFVVENVKAPVDLAHLSVFT